MPRMGEQSFKKGVVQTRHVNKSSSGMKARKTVVERNRIGLNTTEAFCWF